MLRGNRLLANVENQLQKTFLLELEKHQGGTEKPVPPPPFLTAENTDRGVALKKNMTVTLLSLFLYSQAKEH